MASRTILRLLLILALIVAAHSFKPITSRSVVAQLLSAAESLSFVLPDFAEVRIAQASYLATAFSDDSGRSNEGSRRQADMRTLQMVPAALVIGQMEDARTPKGAGCDKSSRPARVIRKPRVNPLIADLPRAFPLERALAIKLPLAEIDLTSMPVKVVRGRFLPQRMVFVPIRLKAMLPARFITRADCDSTIIAEADVKLAQTEGAPREEGPREEGPREEELMFELEFWDIEMPIETMESVENQPAAPSPAPKNCEVPLPEMVMPQQTNIPKD